MTAAVRISVQGDVSAITRHLDRTRGQIERATVRALNRTAKHVRTHSARELAAIHGVPVRALTATRNVERGRRGGVIRIRLARRDRQVAEMIVKRRVNLITLGATATPQGVMVRGKGLYPHAFIGRFHGFENVMQRRDLSHRPPNKTGRTAQLSPKQRAAAYIRAGREYRYPVESLGVELTAADGVFRRRMDGARGYFSAELARLLKAGPLP